MLHKTDSNAMLFVGAALGLFFIGGLLTTALAHPGRLAGEFLIGYACVRIAGETFREPDASLILGLSRGMFYSLFMIIFGLVLRQRRSPPLAELPAPEGTPGSPRRRVPGGMTAPLGTTRTPSRMTTAPFR